MSVTTTMTRTTNTKTTTTLWMGGVVQLRVGWRAGQGCYDYCYCKETATDTTATIVSFTYLSSTIESLVLIEPNIVAPLRCPPEPRVPLQLPPQSQIALPAAPPIPDCLQKCPRALPLRSRLAFNIASPAFETAYELSRCNYFLHPPINIAFGFAFLPLALPPSHQSYIRHCLSCLQHCLQNCLSCLHLCLLPSKLPFGLHHLPPILPSLLRLNLPALQLWLRRQ